jgi:hypothetical protein
VVARLGAVPTPPGRPSALRPTPGATDDDPVEVGEPLCNGMVIIHVDRVVTCTDPMCEAALGGMGAVLDQHSWFVSCAKTLGPECPICHSP